MKTRYLLLFSLFISLQASHACDICGCFMGITPYDNQSSVGLMHRYRVFNGYNGQTHRFFPSGVSPILARPFNRGGAAHTHAPGTGDHSHGNNPEDYEAYRVVELRAKYFLHQRIELNAFVPVAMNTTRYEGSTTNVSGIGDINLFAGYHLIRNVETVGFQQRLIGGAGIKLPTGDYYRKNRDGSRYPMLMQPGTGSVDYFVYLNYITGYDNLGLSLNTSYKLNGENYYKEGIANSTATFINLFYKFFLTEKWQIIPSAQFFYEYTKGETYSGEILGEHQMNNALLGPGLDVFYKNVSLNLAYQLPVYNAPTEHPYSAGRMVIALSYNLNQSKYLLKSKK
jgi:hypothetical protein